jgi:hypothetical protein
VRFGIATQPRGEWSSLRDFVRAIEALAFDSVWIADHPVWIPDCFVSLAAVAGVTQRLRVGTSVACIYYRNPLLIARAAADVDRISGPAWCSVLASAIAKKSLQRWACHTQGWPSGSAPFRRQLTRSGVCGVTCPCRRTRRGASSM